MQQKQTTSSAKSFISGGFGGILAILVGKFSLLMTITKQPLTLISSLLFSLVVFEFEFEWDDLCLYNGEPCSIRGEND